MAAAHHKKLISSGKRFIHHTSFIQSTRIETHTIGLIELCREGLLQEAIRILNVMENPVDSNTYVILLQACANTKSLADGKQVHAHLQISGLEQNAFLSTKLVSMYAKCGSTVDARSVFDKILKPNAFLWNAMIRGYATNGRCEEAIRLYYQMQSSGVFPDKFTFPCVLKACADLSALQQGKQIHDYIVVSGFESDIFVGNALVTMYAKCGNINYARQMFDRMSQRDVVSWNSMIAGYTQNAQWKEATELFGCMEFSELKPDSVTIASVLRASAGLADLKQGKEIHDYIRKTGFEADIIVGNALVAMYAKCGSIEDARIQFDKMPQRDVISWNAMIAGYAHIGFCEEALKLFEEMEVAEIKPDLVSITSVLQACAFSGTLEQGKKVHDYMIRSSFRCDVYVGNALITMYAKCGSIDISRDVFDCMPQRDVVSWNAMIVGYVENSHYDDALELLRQMEVTGMKPDSVTIASILPVCARKAALQLGKEIHGYIIRGGFESVLLVVNALIDTYAKCANVETARKLFDKMLERDVVCWNALVAAYVQLGDCDEALTLVRKMLLAGIIPDLATLVSILPACAVVADLKQGREIHDYLIRSGIESNILVDNALIDMYAKCGSIEDARKVFDKMFQKDVVSWTAMIAGYGLHGHGENALTLFYQMQQVDMKPDHITFVAVLSACSHAGLVDEGCQLFGCMCQDYSITPTMEHYACMVDLLGRSGHLDEAEEFIKNMPLEPNAGVWGTLLGACRNYRDLVVGERVAERLLKLEPETSGYYVLLSNIYAAAGMWDDVKRVRTIIRAKGLEKHPGCSWIEINNIVHAFIVGDR